MVFDSIGIVWDSCRHRRHAKRFEISKKLSSLVNHKIFTFLFVFVFWLSSVRQGMDDYEKSSRKVLISYVDVVRRDFSHSIYMRVLEQIHLNKSGLWFESRMCRKSSSSHWKILSNCHLMFEWISDFRISILCKASEYSFTLASANDDDMSGCDPTTRNCLTQQKNMSDENFIARRGYGMCWLWSEMGKWRISMLWKFVG